MSPDAPRPPLPAPDDATAPYWEAARAGRLELPRCTACERLHFPPQVLCPHCPGDALAWTEVSGRGVVYSWVVVHPPVLPAFRDRTPFAVVLVELEDDPEIRIVGNLLGVDPGELEHGLPVTVEFERIDDEVTLPQWRRR